MERSVDLAGLRSLDFAGAFIGSSRRDGRATIEPSPPATKRELRVCFAMLRSGLDQGGSRLDTQGLYRGEAIDCDLHPAPASLRVLLPYMEEFWREQVLLRGIDRSNLTLASFPPNAPSSCRADFRPPAGPPGSDFDMLKSQALDAFGLRFAICNVLHGALAMRSEDMAAAFCRAVNNWIVKEWLDRDPRLRASIMCAPCATALDGVSRCGGQLRRRSKHSKKRLLRRKRRLLAATVKLPN